MESRYTIALVSRLDIVMSPIESTQSFFSQFFLQQSSLYLSLPVPRSDFRIGSVVPPHFRPTLIVHACRVPRERLEDLSRHRVTFGTVCAGPVIYSRRGPCPAVPWRVSVFFSFPPPLSPITRRARMNDRRERVSGGETDGFCRRADA